MKSVISASRFHFICFCAGFLLIHINLLFFKRFFSFLSINFLSNKKVKINQKVVKRRT